MAKIDQNVLFSLNKEHKMNKLKSMKFNGTKGLAKLFKDEWITM
jgi:hypothetical protein